MSSAPSPIESEEYGMSLCPQADAPPDATVQAGGPDGRPGRVARQQLVRVVTSKNFLSLFDQAVVSATNFGTTILVGRTCIPAELGTYSLALTILILWAAAEETLVVFPYAMQRRRLARAAQTEYAGAVLMLYVVLTLTAVGLLAGGATLVSILGGDTAGLAAALGVLACIIPFSLLRELGRRMSIAHLRLDQVLRLDLTVALLQLAGIVFLIFTDQLSSATAYAAIGLACAAGGGLWLREFSGEFTIRRGRHMWRLFTWNLSMGKWIFLTQMIGLATGYFIQWVVAAVCGEAEVGVYAACLTLVMLTNPFILGISNVLVPRAAQSFADGGTPALRQVVWRSALILGMVMALFCVAALCFNEQLLRFVFRRGEYQGSGHIVVILAFGMLAHALSHPPLNGLAALGRPDVCFRSGALILVAALGTVPLLVTRWLVLGAALGFLACQAIVAAVWWAAFLCLVERVPEKGSAPVVLEGLSPFPNP